MARYCSESLKACCSVWLHMCVMARALQGASRAWEVLRGMPAACLEVTLLLPKHQQECPSDSYVIGSVILVSLCRKQPLRNNCCP